jgi:circadian clock protein KaiC
VSDLQLESLAHGVVDLEQLAPEYGAERRRLRVKKLRGVAYRGGYHDFKVATGGLAVYPRLIAAEHPAAFTQGAVSSGIEELDKLLGGGLERGSSTLITGPAGPGKTSIAVNYLLAAVARGEKAAFYSFEEGLGTLATRARGLGWDLEGAMESGRLSVEFVNPAELSPGEFAHGVQRAVDEQGAKVVVIDSLNGYLNAMPEERHLSLHLQQLLSYLNQRGVATLMVVTQHGFLGAGMQAPVDLSYLSDSVLVLRYFEHEGELQVAISVLKKRSGPHERSIRVMTMTSAGIRLGPPLRDFHGVLTGVPTRRAENGSRDGHARP